MPISQSKLAWLTPNLGILWILVCSFWLCGSIDANPIIYRLVPSRSRYEIRQWHLCWRGKLCWGHFFIFSSLENAGNGVSATLKFHNFLGGGGACPQTPLVIRASSTCLHSRLLFLISLILSKVLTTLCPVWWIASPDVFAKRRLSMSYVIFYSCISNVEFVKGFVNKPFKTVYFGIDKFNPCDIITSLCPY